MSTLFVIATPIGNMSDISERAKATLAGVDVVLCEDTRVTHKLLQAIGVSVQTLSYHQHSTLSKTTKIFELLDQGKNLALVTDAGTPAISDPGGKLIESLVAHYGTSLSIVPIPGPSAVMTALSISGFPTDEFIFLGFPPNKKGRQTYFDRVALIESTVVFYESTHRILKTLEELASRCPARPIVVGRELTKMYETIYRGTPNDVLNQLQSTSIKGEFVVVLRSK